MISHFRNLFNKKTLVKNTAEEESLATLIKPDRFKGQRREQRNKTVVRQNGAVDRPAEKDPEATLMKPAVAQDQERLAKDEPKGTGTVVRKHAPELTALEIAEQQAWEVKQAKVWKPGDVILETYKVEDIKEGGMGYVYMAEHLNWKVKMAIKSPKEEMLSDKGLFTRVLREADAWTELGMHPNIAYCYFVRNIEEVPHIIIEYVDGGNLKEWIADMRCHDLKKGLDLAIQFCHGMEHAHGKGMIHRDIKPENVLMTNEGILKVTDFGIAKGIYKKDGTGLTDDSAGSKKEILPIAGGGDDGEGTTFGTKMGTYNYMSPEQWEDPGSVDATADIYSFGACMYEMFCGRLPYDPAANIPASVLAQTGKKSPYDPEELRKDIPSELSNILKKSAALEKGGRYASFEEIRRDLGELYQKIFNEASPYSELNKVDLEADGLNNRGVSYCEMGRKEDAIEYWEKALKINQTHLEATYNLSLIQWRDATIDDLEVLRRIDNCSNNASVDQERLAKLRASIYARTSVKCLRIMKGHTASLKTVSLTPDGRYAVSGSDDKTVRLWDLKTGQCLHIMKGHTDGVYSASITADAKFAVTGSWDGTIRLWNLETGQHLRTMREFVRPRSPKKKLLKRGGSVSLTPDGQYAVSGWGRLWDLKTGQYVSIMKGHTGMIYSVSLTPDCRYAVSGSDDKTVRFWDLKTDQCLHIMHGHTDGVYSVSINADATYAVSGSADKTIRLWDLKTGHCLRTMKGHTRIVYSVSLTADTRYALSASLDNTLRLWDLKTGHCLRTMKGHTDTVYNDALYSVSLTPDGLHAVSGSYNNTIQLWDLKIDRNYQPKPMVSVPRGFEERKKEVESLNLEISRAEDYYNQHNYMQSFAVLYKSWEGTGFSDVAEINQLYSRLMKKGIIRGIACSYQKNLLEGHTDVVESVSITADGRYAVSGSKDKTLRFWDLKTGKCLRIINGGAKSVTVTSDGRHAVSESGRTIRWWDLETGKCLRNMEGHSDSVSSVSITADGRYAVSGSRDQTVRLWDLETGQCIRIMEGHTGRIRSVSLTPDGRYAVSGSDDITLRMWDLKTGNNLRTISHTPIGRFALASDKWGCSLRNLETGNVSRAKSDMAMINSVSITDDGRYAVSGSMPSALQLWDFESGQNLRTMVISKEERIKYPVNSVSITADGRYAVSGSNDKTIRLWDLKTGQCIRTMEGHTGLIQSVSLTPDGRYAVSGSSDKTVRLWEFIWDLEF